MTFYDAIDYLANSGKLYKAIAELSRLAETSVYSTEYEVASLRAEKRTAKKFIESGMSDAEKVDGVRMLVEG